ncbi:glycosyltransferase involved in cell wall biosynthesis [Arthrobacter sp. PvP023]|uniref:glycosyltransferase family 4 protein n=1 Tax=Micrococcaceae TaxID=1268 RepID=UPI001AE9E9CE|nr:glycosyltransferase family 4 protein [Arthrobacter sp. PvP023]MBP1135101.1 glycosyltransferase involved in cell wall biosynthesis [Arthrobacter sp. PvP023]
MRIAVVHSFYSSQVPSGENNVVLAQVSALESRGHDVRLIAQFTDELESSGTYKFRTAINVATQRGTSPLNELLEFKPDVVHVHNLFPNFSKTWVDSWNGPIVATLHNFRPVCAAGTLYRDGRPCTECVDRGSHRSVVNRCYRDSAIASIPLAIQTRSGVRGDALLRRADRIILLADRAQKMFTSLGLEEHRTALLPNFVDQHGFAPHSAPGSNWTYIGRLTNEKGILSLINSWPENQHLRIFGDGPLRAEVESITSLLPHVEYHGSVPSSHVARILSESRGLVFSSEWPEGAPLVYVEALAAGRPVIAREGNSVADDVLAHGTGLVYTDSNQLTSSLLDVTQNWDLFHTRALSRFNETYSMDAWTTKLENLYNSVIERYEQR